jgi:hypothetical protein
MPRSRLGHRVLIASMLVLVAPSAAHATTRHRAAPAPTTPAVAATSARTAGQPSCPVTASTNRRRGVPMAVRPLTALIAIVLAAGCTPVNDAGTPDETDVTSPRDSASQGPAPDDGLLGARGGHATTPPSWTWPIWQPGTPRCPPFGSSSNDPSGTRPQRTRSTMRSDARHSSVMLTSCRTSSGLAPTSTTAAPLACR